MTSTQRKTNSRFQFALLDALLGMVPIAGGLWCFDSSPLAIFVVSSIAIVPLAGLLGRATEDLSERLGEGIGGLLNASFGNAAELIISLVLLSRGPEMYPLVKASLTGSIVGNVLLVLGMSMFAGGLYHKRQTFNRTAASVGATMLALATIGLIMPAIYYHLLGGQEITAHGQQRIDYLSEEISAILIFVYVLSLVFSLKTHRDLYSGDTDGEQVEDARPVWSRRVSIAVLTMSTVGIAAMSELLVGAVKPAAQTLGMNSVFIGVVIVSIIGNAAEHSTAVWMATKDKMGLAMHIAVGSSLQIALFLAPLLVFASKFFGYESGLDLHFSTIETIAVIVAISVLVIVSQGGECNWMHGVLLLAVYLILAIAIYNLPQQIAAR
jgi:Ca2+:H+ antiporter